MQIPKPAAESAIPSASQVEDEKVEAAPKKNGSGTNSNGHTICPSVLPPRKAKLKVFSLSILPVLFAALKPLTIYFFCQTQIKQVENSNLDKSK